MKQEIIKLKEFEVSFMGNTRPLVFSNGFKDEEIHAWKCEDDILNLYFKNGKKYLLTYDADQVKFIGDFHTGKITVAPVRNFVKRFQELVAAPKQNTVKKEKVKPKKLGKYAIISKLNLGVKDVYKPKGRLTPKVKELLLLGYEWIIIANSATKEDLDLFIDSLDDTTVNYMYDDYRKDWLVGVNHTTIKSLGEFKPLQNFLSNLKSKLERHRKEPNFVIRTKNAQKDNQNDKGDGATEAEKTSSTT